MLRWLLVFCAVAAAQQSPGIVRFFAAEGATQPVSQRARIAAAGITNFAPESNLFRMVPATVVGPYQATFAFDPTSLAAGEYSFDLPVLGPVSVSILRPGEMESGFLDVAQGDAIADSAYVLRAMHASTVCAENSYCPNGVMTHAAMSESVVKAQFGEQFEFPQEPLFSDVPSGAPAFRYIQKIAGLGIWKGCGNGRFCPDDSVTRAQMAHYIVRGLHNDAFSFRPEPRFTDVPSNEPFFPYIQRTWEMGIAEGCDDNNYCAELPLTRGDAAVFLARGFAQYRLLSPMPPPPPPPTIAGCPIFPANNVWNTPIDKLPVHPRSADWVNTIGPTRPAVPDFGSGLFQGGPSGIPFVVVSKDQPRVKVTFRYSDESDAGPYPVAPNAPIEGGANSSGDRHILVLEQGSCRLWELFNAYPQADGSYNAGSGAVFDLQFNGPLRPAPWTSADAAGLPILPGLVRYDEVAAGEIRHAIRFTVPQTSREFVWPARHFASNLTGSQYPPMGARFRLKESFDISGFSPQVQVILRALKRYGMILADNGSPWFLSGAPDDRWDNTMLREIRRITGSAFEAVDTGPMRIEADSGEARQP